MSPFEFVEAPSVPVTITIGEHDFRVAVGLPDVDEPGESIHPDQCWVKALEIRPGCWVERFAFGESTCAALDLVLSNQLKSERDIPFDALA